MDAPLFIGVSLGDITGIGPEVTLKALAFEAGDDTRYLLIGDIDQTLALQRKLGLSLGLTLETGKPSADRLILFNPDGDSLAADLPVGAPAATRSAVAWVREGAKRCLRGELDALVTAPVNKEAIVRAGVQFVGQTELLSSLAATERTAMMLLGTDDRGRWLRVALATTHLPLRLVSEQLTIQKITTTIELTAQACGISAWPAPGLACAGLIRMRARAAKSAPKNSRPLDPPCKTLSGMESKLSARSARTLCFITPTEVITTR